ncbi:2-succinyl-5-enolpyruvyl-6-hydroxy-3-cyclohexene-1-carboxylic-acid synthase [Arthrobacter sp. AET 35A]|uniref:2-succinyl-5-enolpyruvyl-6-hydroxy-3- cyclohexene-1-carboxylic-acid synthase n=1 Tax=Arthrobacter sp. 147(2020) TaxID=2735318 RepID=UPI00298F0D53|nr:2-succinyl-5-enolpyruvyl-6-hydroxy-3-cyclohexene-1-carboxylic-acid synthase [Arthrobacter sp. AET 35A]
MNQQLNSIDAARLAVASLTAAGVRHVVVAPGSRSAPMAYALAEAEAAGALRLHVRIDERVGGFTALGLALGSQAPVAVLTTSGTAVGELLPAVMEANHAAVPLVVLSADRPSELRGSGANQTTNQIGLYGVHVRCALDVPAGTDPSPFVARALAEAQGASGPRGPVQLNLAFRDPLVPDAAAAPVVAPAPAAASISGGALPERALQQRIQTTPALPARTVVVAGHGAGELAAVVAQHLRLPLLAEPSSNSRFGPNAVAQYRLLLEHLGADIERVVVFGRPTLSRPVAALLARTDIAQVLYLPGPVAWFEEGRRREEIITTLADLLQFAGTGEPGWLERWQAAGTHADAAVRSLIAERSALNGLHVADAVWEHTDGNLVLGSSNPIRDADLIASPGWHPLEVYANRGLAGIDGTLSTATGVALATGIPTRLLVGDLTFLHDAGGLLLGPGEEEADLQIVVLNDAGGGIFGLLEHGAEENLERHSGVVERLFGTPHTADLGALAHGYGVRHTLVDSVAALEAALEPAIEGRSIIEVRADRANLRALHGSIKASVSRVV